MNLASAEKEIKALARALGVRAHVVRSALEGLDPETAPPATMARPAIVRAARVATAADMGQGQAIEKFEYVRSRPLCEAFRLIPCQHCGRDDGTVVGAHSNWACHGKGRSIKASDIYQSSLCHTCHSALDQGSKLLERERKHLWWCAHTKSVTLLVSLGHWPDNIAPPNTTDWPF